jgi:sugar O-acyltransferase (sialic acid O-acetyltransferase NeuD family)
MSILHKLGLIGKGGFVREIFASINKDRFEPYILSDVDETLQKFLKNKDSTKFLLCVGNSFDRKKIYNDLHKYNIHCDDYLNHHINNNVHIIDSKSVNIGKGSIICSGSILTSNINIGKMTHINLNCTIGHDVTIGDFITCSPGVNISGNCNIGNNVMIGSNSVIKENINIGENIIIGMGSVITKSLVDPGIYFGNPCKRIKNIITQ